MKKLLILISLVTTLMGCNKVPYDQYYVWENTTDTTLILYVNPPDNPEHPYFPITLSDNICPPMVTVIIDPHSSYTLQGTMTCDYYDEWYSVWLYPSEESDLPYVTGRVKYENRVE